MKKEKIAKERKAAAQKSEKKRQTKKCHITKRLKERLRQSKKGLATST